MDIREFSRNVTAATLVALQNRETMSDLACSDGVILRKATYV